MQKESFSYGRGTNYMYHTRKSDLLAAANKSDSDFMYINHFFLIKTLFFLTFPGQTKISLIEFHKKNTVHDIVQKVSEDCMDSKSSHESDNDSIDFSRIQ